MRQGSVFQINRDCYSIMLLVLASLSINGILALDMVSSFVHYQLICEEPTLAELQDTQN